MVNGKIDLGSDIMIYPKFIKKGDILGVTAPSMGVIDPLKVNCLNNAIKKFEELGFNILETNNVRTMINGVSSEASIRAQELKALYENDKVTAIICVSGGEFLLEMLPYFDFSSVTKNIKWLQGYSDPTGLLFIITTNYDIATIYGNNFKAFGMNNWHKSLNDNLNVLTGKNLEEYSYDLYEKNSISEVTGLEEYNLDTEVYWHNLGDESELQMQGRMIGGCIDLITELFGTKYDKTKEFIKKYKNDGIIWYFDNSELSCEDLVRTLWKFKDNGWFNYCNGIIFGRSACEVSNINMSFEDAIKRVIDISKIPVIIDADFGHVPPRMSIINGAYATVISKEGKGKIEFLLK